MADRFTIGQRVYVSDDLRTVLAKASPERSGDRLAGLTAESVTERMAARLCLADGLSSLAVQRHAAGLLCATRPLLPVLIGERPGLSFPDSLGVYLTWQPRVGMADSQRNCLSNIRPEGLPCEAAARRLAWLLTQAAGRGLTGIGLKDDSAPGLPSPAPGLSSPEQGPSSRAQDGPS